MQRGKMSRVDYYKTSSVFRREIAPGIGQCTTGVLYSTPVVCFGSDCQLPEGDGAAFCVHGIDDGQGLQLVAQIADHPAADLKALLDGDVDGLGLLGKHQGGIKNQGHEGGDADAGGLDGQDIPTCCAVAQMNGKYRASIGARPGRAMLVRRDNAEGFAAFVAENTPTEGNLRGSAAYRTHLTRVLVERSMNELECK